MGDRDGDRGFLLHARREIPDFDFGETVDAKTAEELLPPLVAERWLDAMEIAEKIEKIISKVDYYNYFEEIVEKVIGKLNEINIKVKPQFCQNTLENKAVNLGEVRSSYTMESERIIHDKVVFGTDDSVTQILQKAAEEEIEFF